MLKPAYKLIALGCLLALAALILSQAALLSIPSAQAQVNLVQPQPPRPDGSIVHVVRQGDTINGILNAYLRYSVTLEALQVFNGWRFPPDLIFVNQEIIILPSGSVDPTSGELLVSSIDALLGATPVPPPAVIETESQTEAEAPPVESENAGSSAEPPPVRVLTVAELAQVTFLEETERFLPRP